MAGVESFALLELDSNFLVAARAANSRESRRLENWLRNEVTVQISAVAWSEYLCGPLDEADAIIGRRLAGQVEPFTEQDAELAGTLFVKTGRRSRSHADCMIAAHAIRRNAALATLNLRDFRRFEKFHLVLARQS